MNGRTGVHNVWPKVGAEIQIAISKVQSRLISRHLQWLKRRNIILDCTAWELTGCTTVVFYEHFNCLFDDGMTWFNHGDWHIDHIYPLAAIDPTSMESVLAAFHYTNLRPIWAAQNSEKGATVSSMLAPREVFVRNYGSHAQTFRAEDVRLS